MSRCFYCASLARKPYHPSKPEASLAGRAQGHVGRGDVWRSLQRLDLPGGLAGGTSAHNVHLPHAEPDSAKQHPAVSFYHVSFIPTSYLDFW